MSISNNIGLSVNVTFNSSIKARMFGIEWANTVGVPIVQNGNNFVIPTTPEQFQDRLVAADSIVVGINGTLANELKIAAESIACPIGGCGCDC